MSGIQNKLILTSGLLMGLGVAINAFGAHWLESRIEPKDLAGFKTAGQYHYIHAMGIMLLAAFVKRLRSSTIKWSIGFMTAGLLLFCTPLYLVPVIKALTHTNPGFLHMLVPFGGVSFLIAWFIPAFSVIGKLGESRYKPHPDE